MKRRIKIIAIFIVVGILLAVLKEYFKIDDITFFKYYIAVSVVIILIAVVVNTTYFSKHSKKTQSLIELLNSGNANQFVTEIEEILPKLKNKYLKNIYTINLSTGYCDLSEFEKAKEILISLNKKKLKGMLYDAYTINLCAISFYLNEENALEIYDENQSILKKIAKTKLYLSNIAVIEIFALISKGDIEKATEKLAQTQAEFTELRIQSDYKILEERIRNQQLLFQHTL